MKKTLFLNVSTLFILVLLSSISISTTAKSADFSGNWKLDESKSTLNEQFSMAPYKLIIVHEKSTLKTEKHSSFQGQDFTFSDTLTLDGKECINKGWQDSEKKSTAVWSENKQSLVVTSKINMGDGGEMTIIETYSLKNNNLSVLVSASSSFGDMSETHIFNKE